MHIPYFKNFHSNYIIIACYVAIYCGVISESFKCVNVAIKYTVYICEVIFSTFFNEMLSSLMKEDRHLWVYHSSNMSIVMIL